MRPLGAEHPQVAVSSDNLAALYEAQGRYAAAEPLYRQSLRIRVKAFGRGHPSVARVLENMARCFKELGKEDEALGLEAQAREIRSNK